MDREQLAKAIEVELDLFKTFLQLFTAVVAGLVALAMSKEKPVGFWYYFAAGLVVAFILLRFTYVNYSRMKEYERQYRDSKK